MSSRIADIQSRILALQAPPVRPAQAAPKVAPATGSPDFSAYLEHALATPASATSAASAVLNGQGIPADLAAYGNGKIPASALEPVGATGQRLWAPAARSLTRMTADAKAAGVTIGITDSYRSYADQVDLARRKGLYSQGGLAAQPGTSEHGWGLAADLDLNAQALTWMRANAGRYGFDENVPRESWHWAFKPAAG